MVTTATTPVLPPPPTTTTATTKTTATTTRPISATRTTTPAITTTTYHQQQERDSLPFVHAISIGIRSSVERKCSEAQALPQDCVSIFSANFFFFSHKLDFFSLLSFRSIGKNYLICDSNSTFDCFVIKRKQVFL